MPIGTRNIALFLCLAIALAVEGKVEKRPRPWWNSKQPSFSSRKSMRLTIWQGLLQNSAPVCIGISSACRDQPGFGLLRGIFAFSRQAAPPVRHTDYASPVELPSSFGIVHQQPRGGSQVKTKKPKSKRSTKSSSSTNKKKKKKSHHQSPLSDSKPFYSVDRIGEMTLGDIGNIFEFAVKSTRDDFDEGNFREGMSPRVRSAVDVVKKAAATSRGDHVRIATQSAEDTARPGNFDTFNFCAAMRILTEWRMVRQVPEGYKSFAMSMRMGHKDVVKNIGKIEGAAHDYIDDQKQKGASEIYSPTLRQLLAYEKKTDQHPELPRLKEVSGAMGLLWVRRQMHFQLAFFENARDKTFATSAEAFQSAYARVFSKFHGRALRQVFRQGLKGAPEMKEVYKCMNPSRLQEVASEKDSEKTNRFEFGLAKRPDNPIVLTASEEVSDDEAQLDDAIEQRIALEMENDAIGHMEFFLSVSQPILADLAGLLDEFNMDDPKIV